MAKSSTSFKPGHPGGPGRPKGSSNKVYIDATMKGCSIEDWVKIVERAVTDARKGNARAREWLSSIILGKDPLTVVELVDELRSQLEALQSGMAANGKAAARTNSRTSH